MTRAPTDPIRKAVRVERPIDEAFRIFVDDFGRWWPVERFSRVADAQYADGVTLERVIFEPRAGGRIYEVTSTGVEGSWAEVVAYEPPTRFLLAWKPNDRDEPPTQVEVVFEADGDGTVLHLEHRGWEALPPARVAESRRDHEHGWDLPLQRFATAAAVPSTA